MSTPILSLGLLAAGCFSLATWVGPRLEGASRHSGSVMGGLLGGSQKLFADHFYTRSDVYFHSGYYPSIFDRKKMKENHLAAGAKAEPCEHDHNHEGPCEHDHGHGAKKVETAKVEEKHDHDHEHDHDHGAKTVVPAKEDKHDHADHAKAEPTEHVHGEHCNHGEDGTDFLGKPKDYFDAFSRNFFVSKHTHLTDKGTNGAKEILPWIQLSAKLDPRKVESYTVGAYWLRELKRNDEAEQFLREGLRLNPDSYEIMLELGRGYVVRQDFERARNVLEMAFRYWRERENSKPPEAQDRFNAGIILNHLVLAEDRLGNREKAVGWLGIVRKVSPHPEEIDKRIAEVKSGKPFQMQ